MKTIILEGTSTSGKTTLANLLVRKLEKIGKKTLLVDESQTLMPVLKFSDTKKHINHLNKIIDSFSAKECDFIVVDRLHLTSAAVCNMKIGDFKKIEKKLLKNSPVIIFLKVDEDRLGSRILEAIKHRKNSWVNHVASKGGKKEIEAWYLETQRKLLKRLGESKIKHITFNTSSSDYKNIAEKLMEKCNIFEDE